METKGRIESYEQRLTKENKPYVKVKIDNKVYNCFDAKLTQGVQVGDDVEITYDENTAGGVIFKNLRSIRKLNEEAKVSEEKVIDEDELIRQKERFDHQRRYDILLGQCANWAAGFLIEFKMPKGEFVKAVPLLARELMDECKRSGVFGL